MRTGGTTRRQLLRRGAGGAALLGMPGFLAACGGGDDDVKVSKDATDPWRRYAGTELNFISENTAPTLAIGANLAEFEKLTGIRI